MGEYDFKTVIDRADSDSARYHNSDGAIPLTYADTDFMTSEKVVEAIKNRAKHPLFGYVKETSGWKKALIRLYQKRFGLALEEDQIAFSSNVLTALDAFLFAFTKPEDPVIITTPVYNCFFSCVKNSGRKVLEVPVKEVEGRHLDLNELSLAMEKAHVMLLCSPHNPMGFAFSKEELTDIVLLAKSKGCLIFSDEIHGLIGMDYPYIPTLCVEEARDIVVMSASPSKTFNTAGVHAAFVASKNEELLKRIVEQLGRSHCGSPSCFAQPVLEAAFEDEGYVDAFLNALRTNRDYLLSRIEEDGRLSCHKNPFTYLAWIDCGRLSDDAEKLLPYFKKRGVVLLPGILYGKEGKHFLRLNFALPFVQLKKALDALFLGLDDFEKSR